ncbi:alpha/beta hydrolase [Streptomyces sp. NPDC058623]|uniref:poly(ethylene terephthalate) hydrolase family protein n=1 Tax=Streptomyces sp. NPDC058623 TaxID=3346563 RepID=UPI00364AB028
MLRTLLRAVAAIIGAISTTLAAPTALAAPAPVTVAADPSAPGAHPVAWADLTVTASGRSYSARVWYPGRTAGANTAVATGVHPGLAFGHGFVQDISRYENTLRHYASWGFITVTPKSQGGVFPSHSAFADDLNAGLAWLTAQNAATGSRFAGAVDTSRYALSGHSMGGGAAMLAASRNPAVKSVSTLAAAETNPSAAAAGSALSIPAQYVGGSKDTVAGVDGHQRKMYDAKPAPTQLRVITGGFHCGFTDSAGFGCDSGSITRTEQQRLVRSVTTSYLLFTLGLDNSLRDQVWGSAAQNLPGVVYTAKP